MQDKMKRGSVNLTIGNLRRLLAYTRCDRMLRIERVRGNRSNITRRIWIVIMA